MAVAACGDSTPPPPATTTRDPAAPQPLPTAGVVEAGLYSVSDFKPAIVFETANRFNATAAGETDVFSLSRGEASDVSFGVFRVESVFSDPFVPDPVARNWLGKTSPVPTDLVAWYRTHPFVDVSAEQMTTIAGRPASRLDVTTKPLPPEKAREACRLAVRRCITLFKLAGRQSFVGLLEQSVNRHWIVDVDGKWVVFAAYVNHPSRLDPFTAEVEALLATVRFT